MEIRLSLIGFFCAVGLSMAQNVSIPDPSFEQWLIDFNYDTDGIVNGEMSQGDADNVTIIILGNVQPTITDLTGIESMPNLTNLTIIMTAISSIDLNVVPSLTDFNVNNDASLTSVIGSNNIESVTLNGVSNLQNLDLSTATNLELFNISSAQLTSIDFSNCPNLSVLSFNDIVLTQVNILPSQPITNISAGNSTIPIDPSPYDLIQFAVSNSAYTEVDLQASASLDILRLENNANLTRAFVNTGANTQLSYVNIEGNPQLTCIVVDDVTYSTNNWDQPNAVPPLYVDTPSALVDISSPCATISVADVEREEIVPYPIPVGDRLYWSGNTEDGKLIDLHGREVASGNGITGIATYNLASGIYLLVVKGSPSRVHIKKIIID